MKIYSFTWDSGSIDWVFAPTIQEARGFYLNFAGCGELSDCKVQSVPKKEWSNKYILDINESEPFEGEYNEDDYSCGYRIQETFAEYASKNKYTDIICTTEF